MEQSDSEVDKSTSVESWKM